MNTSPCCWICKTPSGVCAIPSCEHHRQDLKRQIADDTRGTTYADPTARHAVNNIMRQQRNRRK